jgi:PKD repeat protein
MELSAHASADRTSGAAPLTVQFTGAADGGTPPYVYSWDFGERSPSLDQNPSHTYAGEGVYRVELTVIDDTGATATDSLTVTVSPVAEGLIASASADTISGIAPLTVHFAGSASGGTPPYTSYAWELGDGTASAVENPSHTYAGPGNYVASLTVTDSASAVATASLSITVSAAEESLYTVPSVAHAAGKNNTAWRTDIAAVNLNATDAALLVTFTPLAGTAGAPTVRMATLAAGTTVEWPDVLVSLFAFPGSASEKGSVQIASALPLRVTSRTYNQTPGGTFGQLYPALTADDGLVPGQIGVIPLLKKTTEFRSNVAVQNLGNAPCTVAVTLHGGDGTQVGAILTRTLPPYTYYQWDDVFARAGAPGLALAYATVVVPTAGGRVWACASLLDNRTGDPTTVPVLVR